jgi:hypothetical protein
LSESVPEGGRVGPALLALALFVTWGGIAPVYAEAEHLRAPWGITHWVNLEWMLGPLAVGVATVLYLGSLGLFALRGGHAGAATVAFGVLFLYAHVEVSLNEGADNVMHGKFLPGGALLGWLIGSWSTRLRDRRLGAKRGVELAAGVAAGLYLWAAMIKLLSSGADWSRTVNLPLLVLERSYTSEGAVSALRRFIGLRPWLGSVLAYGALSVEFAGVSMLWPRYRRIFATTAMIMHLCIGVLMGYWYVEWWITLWAIAVWTRELQPPAANTA